MSFPFGPRVEEADVRATTDALRDDPEAVLVDVREPDEWQAGHVAGARHIPMGELPSQLSSLQRDAPIYLICRSGTRSHKAATFLARAGFTRPTNVKGGMLAWEEAGLPVER